MKKLICLLVTMCAMILMCSVAGAGWCDEHEWTYVSLGRWYHVKMCEVCGLSNDESHSSTDSWEYIDLGDRSPCRSCTRVKDPKECENKCCRAWNKWFMESWNAIHGYYRRYEKKEEQNELEK